MFPLKQLGLLSSVPALKTCKLILGIKWFICILSEWVGGLNINQDYVHAVYINYKQLSLGLVKNVVVLLVVSGI